MPPRYKYVRLDRSPAPCRSASSCRKGRGLRGRDLPPIEYAFSSPQDVEDALVAAEQALQPPQEEINRLIAEGARFKLRSYYRRAYQQDRGGGAPSRSHRERIAKFEQAAARLYDDRDRKAPLEALRTVGDLYPTIRKEELREIARRKDPREIADYLDARRSEMARGSHPSNWDEGVAAADRGIRSLSLWRSARGMEQDKPTESALLFDAAKMASKAVEANPSQAGRAKARSAWLKVAAALEAEGKPDTHLAVVNARNHARMYK